MADPISVAEQFAHMFAHMQYIVEEQQRLNTRLQETLRAQQGLAESMLTALTELRQAAALEQVAALRRAGGAA